MTTSQRNGSTSLDSLFAERGGKLDAFSSKVSDYASSRPGYPAALFDCLASRGILVRDVEIADVGAGTGLFTRELLERGHAVVAVEPNASMLAVADESLRAYRRYRSRIGRAEATGLRNASVDFVTVAQAFHWFDAAAARREWLRILRPGGRVALVWNMRQLADPVQKEIDGLLAGFGGEKHAVLNAHQDLSDVPKFFNGGSFERVDFDHSQRVDQEGLASLVFSRSYMPDRDSADGMRAARALSELFGRHSSDGQLTVNYRTVAFIGRPHPDPEPRR